MDQAQIVKVCQALDDQVPGVSFVALTSFVDGMMKVDKKGIASLPLKIDLAMLEPKSKDLRALTPPAMWNNKLVPVLAFIDVEKYQRFLFDEEAKKPL